MEDFKLFIDGKWTDSSENGTENITNPTNEEIVGRVQQATPGDVDRVLKAAEKAQRSWKMVPAQERAAILRKFAQLIATKKEKLAQLLTKEQGKLLKVARFEVDVCCSFIDYACGLARHLEGHILPSDNESEQIWIQKVPKGVVVAITAWNFPLALAARKFAPALITGNAIVIKPTPEAPLSTLALGDLVNEAGVPPGVFNMVTGGVEAGQALVSSRLTKMITMTGGTPTGQAIAKAAAQNLTHVQLELGGKAPFIVFEDADLGKAVDAALHSRFDNCGQVCTCNERMYLHASIYNEFMEKFIEKVDQLVMGDPMEDATDIGPKMNAVGVEHLEKLVADSVAQGAKVIRGGKRPSGPGFEKGHWFEPTILSDVTQDMAIVHEELFGPVLPVLTFSDTTQVIEYANDSDYGLAAMVFTNDMKRIMRLKNELEFGEIYINRGHGEQHQGLHNGLKLSGTGGEDGLYGLDQYMEKKTFYVNYQ